MANTIRTSGFGALVDAIKAARQARGLTQRDLAKRLGCQNATVANIETGSSSWSRSLTTWGKIRSASSRSSSSTSMRTSCRTTSAAHLGFERMANTIRTSGFSALVEAIKAARKARGMTQVDLARRLGCLQATVANIETGQRRIDVIELMALAEALDEDPRRLFEIALEHLDPDELQNNFSRSSRW